jgi:hypothetical protein
MADALNTQEYHPTLVITNAAGAPAPVDGAPVWASSDETVISVVAAAGGMSAVAACVAPGVARLTASADADMGTGVTTLTIVSEDINVTLDPANQASVMTMTLGTPVAKGTPVLT